MPAPSSPAKRATKGATKRSTRSAKRSTKRSTKRSAAGRAGGTDARKWSAQVTARSNALDLDARVFTWKDPRRIAASLKRSVERSKRRKGTPFQSAMSMLTFYINRSGDALAADQKRVLERAKEELRRQFGRT